MYPPGFFSTMSQRVAVALHWFLLAPAVVFPEVLARPSKQYLNEWNAPSRNNSTSYRVDSAAQNSQRLAAYKENLRPYKRSQRSLLLDSDLDQPGSEYGNSPPISYPNPNTYSNPNPVSPAVGNGFSSVGNPYPVGNSQPNPVNTFSGVGNGYPVVGSGYPGTGNGYPGTADVFPGAGSGYPGIGNGYPGTGNFYPGTGTGNGYPGTGTGNVYLGTGNLYLGTGAGNGYPGTGTGNIYPGTGTGNVYSGTGTGNIYPETGTGNVYPGAGTGNVYPGTGKENVYPGSVYQDIPQSGTPNPQSVYQGGNPGISSMNPGIQSGYPNPNSGFSPFSPYSGNSTLSGNSPYSPFTQYQPSMNPYAPYPQTVNTPTYNTQPYGPPQNPQAYPVQPYNGYDLSPTQGAAPLNPKPYQNPQGFGSPGIGESPQPYIDLLPCQVLCCLLSLCHIFAMPPCTSCSSAPGIQPQQAPPVSTSSRAASSPKVVAPAGREVAPEKIAVTKDAPAPSSAEQQPSPTSPKPADLSAPSSDSEQKPSSAELDKPITPTTLRTPPEASKEASSGAESQAVPSVPKADDKTSTNVMAELETPPVKRQPSAPQENTQPPPIANAVRSLEITPPPQPSTTSEKTEHIAGTRSLI